MSGPRDETRFGVSVTVWPNGRVTFPTAEARIAYRAAEAAESEAAKKAQALASVNARIADRETASMKARQEAGQLTLHERVLMGVFGEIK